MATRKKRKTKGRAVTEERARVNKKTGKPVKHHISLGDKILATDLYITQKKSASETKAELKKRGTDLPENTIRDVANKARKQAEIHGRALHDITNSNEAPRPGRPKALEPDQADALARYVTSSRITRMKTAQEHINHLNLCISVELFQNLMYDRGLARQKAGWKTRLTKVEKEKRYAFALKYCYFDWHKVIFTDEASIRGLEVRGQIRGWGQVDEKYHKDMILRKGDGYSMGMIWACFGYDVKGPVHFYRTETEEKQRRQHDLDLENAQKKPNIWLAYMATEALATNPETGKCWGGKAAQINNFAKKHLKTRGDRSRGGIDWLVHQEGGLAKLVAWIKELREKYPEREWIVYEDGAKSHWSPHNAAVFEDNHIAWLEDLPPHTPEGNAIEQAWSWERKDITRKEGRCRGVSSDWSEACSQWKRSWKDLDQKLINQWIDDIPNKLQKIIDANGDNDFHG